jgi:hypothetical protein
MDVVQNFFLDIWTSGHLDIWKNSKIIKIDTSLRAYFFGAIIKMDV